MSWKEVWKLEIDLPFGSKYERLFPSYKEAVIEHMYLESEGLKVDEFTITNVTNDKKQEDFQ